MKNFMRLAVKKAAEGIRRGQSPFGACIVKNGKVIACAHNSVWKDTDITAHAEMRAIAQACRKLKTVDLSACVIYSTCEPCPMCFSACHWSGISKIVYGCRISDAKKSGFNELVISAVKMKRLGKAGIKLAGDCMRKENLELFKSWARRKDKKVY